MSGCTIHGWCAKFVKPRRLTFGVVGWLGWVPFRPSKGGGGEPSWGTSRLLLGFGAFEASHIDGQHEVTLRVQRYTVE